MVNMSIKFQPGRHCVNFCYPLLFIHVLSGTYEKDIQDNVQIGKRWCGLEQIDVDVMSDRYLE